MHTLHAKFLRTARLIHADLVRQAGRFDRIQLPDDQWCRLQRTVRTAELAHDRGWHAAARSREQQLLREINDLESALARLTDQLQERVAPKTIAAEAELYRDLVALQSEFEDVQCDQDEHVLSVTTQPVVLDGIELGRFQIRLDWQCLQETSPYAVVALDPNPAQSNDSVTHPHVNGQTLCEGSGRGAIEAALTQGRLGDFFTIVAQLLNTYAEGRAYVELDQWNGTACHECGSVVSEDDSYRCGCCEETVCSDCISFCAQCDQAYCSGCNSSCQRCEQSICSSCLERCRACGSHVCADCLQETLCTQCHEKQSLFEEEPEELETPASPASLPAVHTPCLGQIDLPA